MRIVYKIHMDKDLCIPTIKCTLADGKKYLAIIDTGAECSLVSSLIDSKAVSDISFDTALLTGLTSFGTMVKAKCTLDIQNKIPLSIDAFAINFSFLEKEGVKPNKKLVIILGADFLKKYNGIVDFEKMQLTLLNDLPSNKQRKPHL